jgi:bifunctional non-homologous end joining protein LigD
MQIRRNTKAFKTILEIVSNCQTRADRQKYIRLYITRAGKSIQDRISVEGIEGEANVFYDLNYQSVLNNLTSPSHQLYQSDDVPGIYYFHSSSKDWDETPFEFDTRVAKEFSSLPELPTTREKGATTRYSLSEPQPKNEPLKKPKPATPVMVVEKGPPQPNYKLKNNLRFTDLDKVFFRRERLSKKDILDHYNKISEYILPYLKDRPVKVRLQSDMGPYTPFGTIESVPKKPSQEIPDWLQTEDDMLLCNDKDHLLFYVELGCVEFDPLHARRKSVDAPDYFVIGIDAVDVAQIAEVAIATREVLNGLYLHSNVKTDGATGLHVYVPLDSKSDFDTAQETANFICRLVRLKKPDIVALKGIDDHDYGKVTLDAKTTNIVAPYSFIAGGSPTIATPLLWEEVTEDLKIDFFNHESIFDRLKKLGDPFEDLMKKKANSEELLKMLKQYYSFLV